MNKQSESWNIMPDGQTVQIGTRRFVASTNPEYPIDRADAALISAAPTMFDALKSAEIAVMEHCEGQDTANECYTILRIIRAAIRKAEQA
jgi:hypothetical protein